jgi:hypothetical protein
LLEPTINNQVDLWKIHPKPTAEPTAHGVHPKKAPQEYYCKCVACEVLQARAQKNAPVIDENGNASNAKAGNPRNISEYILQSNEQIDRTVSPPPSTRKLFTTRADDISEYSSELTASFEDTHDSVLTNHNTIRSAIASGRNSPHEEVQEAVDMLVPITEDTPAEEESVPTEFMEPDGCEDKTTEVEEEEPVAEVIVKASDSPVADDMDAKDVLEPLGDIQDDDQGGSENQQPEEVPVEDVQPSEHVIEPAEEVVEVFVEPTPEEEVEILGDMEAEDEEMEEAVDNTPVHVIEPAEEVVEVFVEPTPEEEVEILRDMEAEDEEMEEAVDNTPVVELPASDVEESAEEEVVVDADVVTESSPIETESQDSLQTQDVEETFVEPSPEEEIAILAAMEAQDQYLEENPEALVVEDVQQVETTDDVIEESFVMEESSSAFEENGTLAEEAVVEMEAISVEPVDTSATLVAESENALLETAETIESVEYTADSAENIIETISIEVVTEAEVDSNQTDAIESFFESATVAEMSTSSAAIVEESEEIVEEEVASPSSNESIVIANTESAKSGSGIVRSDSIISDSVSGKYPPRSQISDLSASTTFSDDELTIGETSETDNNSVNPSENGSSAIVTRKGYTRQPRPVKEASKDRDLSFLRQRGLHLPGLDGEREHVKLHATPQLEKEHKDYVVPWKNMHLRHVERPELAGIYHQSASDDSSLPDSDRTRRSEERVERPRSMTPGPIKKSSSNKELNRERDLSWARQRGLHVANDPHNHEAVQLHHITPIIEGENSSKNASWKHRQLNPTAPKESSTTHDLQSTSAKLNHVGFQEDSDTQEKNPDSTPWKVSLKHVQRKSIRNFNYNENQNPKPSTGAKAVLETVHEAPVEHVELRTPIVEPVPEFKPAAPKGNSVRDLVKRFTKV